MLDVVLALNLSRSCLAQGNAESVLLRDGAASHSGNSMDANILNLPFLCGLDGNGHGLRHTTLVVLVEVHLSLDGVIDAVVLAPGTESNDLIKAGATEVSVLGAGVREESVGGVDVGPLSALLDVVEDALETEMEVLILHGLGPGELVAERALATAGRASLELPTESRVRHHTSDIVAADGKGTIALHGAIVSVLEFNLDTAAGRVVVESWGLGGVLGNNLLSVDGIFNLVAVIETLSLEHGLLRPGVVLLGDAALEVVGNRKILPFNKMVSRIDALEIQE